MENAGVVNAGRFGTFTGFVLIYALSIVVFENPTPGHTASLLAAYWVIAGLIWIFCRR